MICMYWRRKRNAEAKEKSQNAADANEALNTDQVNALRNMTKTS